MGRYFPLKRKELEEINDDLTDFSLSSPATKIRRLDALLPPILEEEEYEAPMPALEQEHDAKHLTIEEFQSEANKKERAIVVFNPTNNLLVQQPSDFYVSVDPQILSGIKSQALWSGQPNSWGHENDENKTSSKKGESLAVVPWVPSQLPAAPHVEAHNSEMMDGEEMVEARMDVDDDATMGDSNDVGGRSFNESLHHWQRQHCMIPQPLQNNTTPVMWY